jgi:hypothetical protein
MAQTWLTTSTRCDVCSETISASECIRSLVIFIKYNMLELHQQLTKLINHKFELLIKTNHYTTWQNGVNLSHNFSNLKYLYYISIYYNFIIWEMFVLYIILTTIFFIKIHHIDLHTYKIISGMELIFILPSINK